MAVDPDTLNDPILVRRLMTNAHNLGEDALVLRCQIRIGELLGRSFDDPIEREFWTMVAVAEELLTVENGKTTRLTRTRQKEKRVGVRQCLVGWASETGVTKGFELLLSGGRPEMTGEAIVLRHREHFAEDVVAKAADKLRQHGIDPSTLTS